MVEKAKMRRKISQKEAERKFLKSLHLRCIANIKNLKFFAKNLFGMQSAISVEDAFCKHCGGKHKTEEEF